jgi:hypothetical protein
MNLKSERLKKLEMELTDLDQWLRLGLVPKKDIEKHKEEMRLLTQKIEEEKERLRYLKESGEVEEFTPPKRPSHGRIPVQELPTLPDMDITEEGMTEGFEVETASSYEIETESGEFESEEGGAAAAGGGAAAENEEEGAGSPEAPPPEEVEEEEEEDPFSDRNRWRRGILEDPDAREW